MFNFPKNPTPGQQHVIGKGRWEWNPNAGPDGAWETLPYTEDDVTYVTEKAQEVDQKVQAALAKKTPTAPENPLEGQKWIDESDGREYTWVVNSTNQKGQWVEITAQLNISYATSADALASKEAARESEALAESARDEALPAADRSEAAALRAETAAADAGVLRTDLADQTKGSNLISYIPKASIWRKKDLTDVVSRVLSDTGVPLEKYLPENYVTDGSVDYTAQIQLAINENSVVSFPGFPLLVNDTGINIPSNRILNFSKGSVLNLAPSDKSAYNIINIQDVENVIINGMVINGDRESHIGTTGEWGMGVNIRGSRNITLNGVTTNNCWGDGIYIGQTANNNVCEDILINDHISDKNRRQGMSVISARRLIINNPKWTNTSGTAPQAGLDIEPNAENSILEGIRINNPYTENNAGPGILIFLKYWKPTDSKIQDIDIVINDHVDVASSAGEYLNQCDFKITGRIVFNKSVISDTTLYNIGVRSWTSESDVIRFVSPSLKNPNRRASTLPIYSSHVSIQKTASNEGPDWFLGGVTVENPTFHLTDSVSPVYQKVAINDEVSQKPRNIRLLGINEPTDFMEDTVWYQLKHPSNQIILNHGGATSAAPAIQGVPTGRIVSRIQNERGTALRFETGEMICYHHMTTGPVSTAVGSIFKSADLEWRYPLNFTPNTIPSVSVELSGYTTNCWVGSGSSNTNLDPRTFHRFAIYRPEIQNSGSSQVTLMAIGRWFAAPAT